ncbi:countin-3-like isoform X2 [Dysidea avara]|uniref:countin-3-like isoform X2 n=1 Tax=Dysidea avara TaxID=196820 RepID=UPI00332A0B6F
MKTDLVLWLLASLLVPALALQLSNAPHSKPMITLNREHEIKSEETCNICIDFADEAIQTLLQLIVDGIAIDGCSPICEEVAKRTNNDVGEACEIICSIVGVYEFMKLVEKADLDPIYYCELLDQCEVNDNGDAKFTNVSVIPKSGPQGMFQFPVQYVSKNGTSTGVIGIAVDAVDGLPIEDFELNYAQDPGTYNVGWNLKAVPDPDCNPPCENWLPGIYNVTIVICAGQCGSHHPHSKIYDEAHLSFEITGN